MPGQKPGFRGTLEERFWRKVQKTDGCWWWTAAGYKNGYGLFTLDDHRVTGAHRVSYTLSVGPIPAGLLVLHRCDNRRCVRPDHLFLGTAQDNLRDAIQKGRFYPDSDRKCPNGHEYPEGVRRCATCAREKEQRRSVRRRATRSAMKAA